MADDKTLEPWRWQESTWREVVNKVRAGRSLAPKAWPNGARCAVALSFDSDHETIELRNGGKSFGKISQGQYGGRRGSPRILDCLRKHDVKASFFMPAVSALLNPDEPKAVISGGHELGIHSWIHEMQLPARLRCRARPQPARRRNAREAFGRASGWHAHRVLGFLAPGH